jgi:hypothetical protein
VKKYLAFALPAAAVLLAAVLWLSLPVHRVAALAAEGGLIESATLFGYGAAMVAVALALRVAADRTAVAAVLLLLAFFGAREMDLHIRLTGTSVLRVSYYLRGPFTGEKVAALAVIAAVIACMAYLCRRYAAALLRDWRSGRPLGMASVVFCVTAAAAKSLDRSVSILTRDFGIPVPGGTAVLVQALEETLELSLPLVVLAAAAQFLRGRLRYSSRSSRISAMPALAQMSSASPPGAPDTPMAPTSEPADSIMRPPPIATTPGSSRMPDIDWPACVS